MLMIKWQTVLLEEFIQVPGYAQREVVENLGQTTADKAMKAEATRVKEKEQKEMFCP